MGFHLISSSSSTVTTGILFVTVIAFLLRIMLKKKRVNNEPPVLKGAWPIIGHLPLLGGSGPKLPHHVLSDMADKYGPIFTMKLGVHKAVVVSNGEVAKECFTTNDKIFTSRPKSVAVEIMGYNYAAFGLIPYGDYWLKVRKMVAHEVLSQRRVKMLEHVRVSEIKASMKDMYESWLKNKESQGGSDMVKMDMSGWFEKLALNVILRILFGKSYPRNHDQEGIRSQKAVRAFFDTFATFALSDYVPFLDGFDIGGSKKKMKVAADEFDKILQGWLKERKRENAFEKQQAFIDVMISILQDSNSEEDYHFPDYDQDTVIKATCLTILVGATDTMAVALTWALSLLMNSPKTMKAVQDEIDEHVGRERLVEPSDTKKLVYLQAVIKETLRLHPPGPLSVPRESLEDCVVSGYNIPKGTQMFVNLWKLHRDPNVWSDPHEFQPERFLKSQKDIDLRGNHFELIPFNSGRRMCPGIFYALDTLPFIMASVLQQFRFIKASDESMDMTEGVGQLTTPKATPLEVLIAPRLSLNVYSNDAA